MNVEETVPKEKNKEKGTHFKKGRTKQKQDQLFEETPAKQMKFHRKRAEEKITTKDTTIAKKFVRKRIHEQRSKNQKYRKQEGWSR